MKTRLSHVLISSYLNAEWLPRRGLTSLEISNLTNKKSTKISKQQDV